MGADDVDAVQLALYLALAWNNPPDIPDPATVMAHPEVVIYHRGWGRTGDIGVKAVADERTVGAAFARLFTEESHGYGYVDAQTPELGVGVVAGYRGHGLGRRLLEAIADQAQAEGILRLSLSVNNPNPAKRLYQSLGYTTVGDDGDSSVMVLDLGDR
jgi:GNAT superfamily N-acetyltransferase